MIITVSTKGQIVIPREIREPLHINTGDKFDLTVSKGNIVLKPVEIVPKNQAWFWTDEVQEKIKKAEENFKTGKVKRYSDAGKLIKDLKARK